MGYDGKGHDYSNIEFELKSYSDCQSVHEAVSRKLTSPEKTSPMVTHIGACPVRKACPVNGEITFDDEEEDKTNSCYIHDILKRYPRFDGQPEGLREEIKKGHGDKNPGGKSRKEPGSLAIMDSK